MGFRKKSESFSSSFTFIIVLIAFAVGVGSLWRFPYVCGINGGALFIIAYIAVIFLICIPLLTAEISIGFKSRKTPVRAYKNLAPGTKWYLVGYLHIFTTFLIMSYIILIYVWILAYIYRTATGFFTGMSPEEISLSFAALNDDYVSLFTFAAVNWFLCAYVVDKGLQNGIEKVSKYLLPFLGIIMLIIIVKGLSLEGSGAGVEFLLKPRLEDFSVKSLTIALGQAFYAIGIAMLCAMVFGCYMKNKRHDVLGSSVWICGAIIIAGVAAGFMIFPMVFAFGLEPSSGAGLTMITLPNVFNQMEGGRIIGTLFYIGFYLAAFSSAIPIVEALTAVTMDGLRVSRRKALLAVTAVLVAVGSVALVSEKFFAFIDTATTVYLLIAGAFLISIFVGWVWGADNFLDSINVKNRFLRIWLKVSVKYICPAAILTLFILNFI